MSFRQTEFQRSNSYEEAISRAAAESRIDSEYWDIFHKRHEASLEVQKGILSALGWDTSSREAVDAERAQRFRNERTAVLPVTAVVSESDKSVVVAFPQGVGGIVTYNVTLEAGWALAGTQDLSQLEWVEDVWDGETRYARFRLHLSAEVPLGYHKLYVSLADRHSGDCHLIICPDRTYLPDSLAGAGRTAGFNITLYGLRSSRNWGCGDFADLRTLIDWARAEIGVSFIGLNPLHAIHNRAPYNTSPYLPLSIYYKNFIYIDVEDVPEFGRSACARQLLESAPVKDRLRKLRESQFVAYQEVAGTKRRFLKLLFRQFLRDRVSNPDRARAFDQYCEREGDLLHKFALYCTLDEVLHKQDRNRWVWQQWPLEFQTSDSEACRDFAARYPRTLAFYKYLQFVIDEQLAAAQDYAKQHGLSIGLYHDLALATDNSGSDLWAHREFYVHGCRVGAPPDDFSPNGQDWAFPPPNSESHRNSGYLLYRESIRKIVKNGGALRIDHVMRLIRLFWIPAGAAPAQGAYVQDYATDLMRILALESVRNRNIIVGEDLGTITDEMREMLTKFGILSYRCFYFEKRRDGSFRNSWEYPRQALVASSTHDLPTMCGFWINRDIEARKSAGLADERAYQEQIANRKSEKQQMLNLLHQEQLVPDSYPRSAEQIPEVDGVLHNAIIAFLCRVPSMLLLLNGEDITKETEQQNLPGSTTEYPNWQRKMKVSLEELRTPVWQPFAAMFRDRLEQNGRKS